MLKYICLLGLLATCYGVPKGCHKFGCGASNDFTDKQCIIPDEASDSLKLKVCKSSDEYCPSIESFTETASCQPVLPSTIPDNSKYPGEYCEEDKDCKTNKCSDKACVGEDEGSECLDNFECKPTLRCGENGTCVKLLEVGSTGCASDYDCVNNAGCNNLALETNGTCVTYYSLKTGDKLGKCESGFNLLCTSLSCKTSSDTGAAGVCVDPDVSTTFPLECDQDSDCVSKTGGLGTCTCGYNPLAKGYCELFYGDKPWQQVFELRRQMVSDTRYSEKCHTEARHNDECIKTAKGTKFYNEYTVANQFAMSYPKIYGNDNCAKYIYNQDYWEAYRYIEDLEDDDDFARLVGVVSALLLALLF
jgi:hypothetical protein